jgi:segregation and condensation protein A
MACVVDYSGHRRIVRYSRYMMMEAEYKVQIGQFEGPLDLLLHLIGRARIDIEQIFVSEVTGQYLDYVAEIPALSMDKASEFIEMAATLVYIKSRMILPCEPIKDDEEEDPEQELIDRLKAYKVFKDASLSLKERESAGLDVYYKLPEEIAFGEEKWEIEQVTLDSLCDAFREVLLRLPDAKYERVEEVQIQKDMFTVKERTRYILKMLGSIGSASFFSLFEQSRTRLEVAVTFLALLDLIHKNLVSISQKACYQDIMITRKDEVVAV